MRFTPEAMTMFHRLQTKKAPAGQESVFLVSERCFPQTIDVLRGHGVVLRRLAKAWRDTVEMARIQDWAEDADGFIVRSFCVTCNEWTASRQVARPRPASFDSAHPPHVMPAARTTISSVRRQ